MITKEILDRRSVADATGECLELTDARGSTSSARATGIPMSARSVGMTWSVTLTPSAFVGDFSHRTAGRVSVPTAGSQSA